jgi:hypothetical protein
MAYLFKDVLKFRIGSEIWRLEVVDALQLLLEGTAILAV